MTHVPSAIVVAKTATLLLGGLVTYFAFRAFRRTGEAALRALAVGFAVVTLGALAAGVLDQLVGAGRPVALLVESTLTAVGFAVVVYSLYVE